jgi:hypothetical protein
MSENTRDAFPQPSAEIPDEATPSPDEVTPQAEPPAEDETPASVEPSPAEQATEEASALPPESSTLPPEAQGEANGGPLGCCLGTMVGLLLSLSLALLSRAYATSLGSLLQGNFWLLGLLVRILMGIMAFVLAIIFGYFGWRLGKRFYREYEPPVIKTRQRRSGTKKARSKA